MVEFTKPYSLSCTSPYSNANLLLYINWCLFFSKYKMNISMKFFYVNLLLSMPPTFYAVLLPEFRLEQMIQYLLVISTSSVQNLWWILPKQFLWGLFLSNFLVQIVYSYSLLEVGKCEILMFSKSKMNISVEICFVCSELLIDTHFCDFFVGNVTDINDSIPSRHFYL